MVIYQTKFGKNPFMHLTFIAFTSFCYGRTDGRTDGRTSEKYNASGLTKVGGGIMKYNKTHTLVLQ